MGRPVRLQDDGVLWLVNRALFHRVGYALGVDELGAFHLMGDGTEEWGFAPAVRREASIRAVMGDAAIDRLLAMAGPEPDDEDTEVQLLGLLGATTDCIRNLDRAVRALHQRVIKLERAQESEIGP